MTDEFKTKDLVLASFLKYNNVEFAKGYEHKTQSWVFKDPDKCKALSLQLHNGTTTVEVLRYESIRRNLLGMAHDKFTE